MPEPVDIRDEDDDEDVEGGGDPEPVGEPALAGEPVEEPAVVLRRSTRERKKKVIFDPSASLVHSCILLTDAGEPESYREALASGSRSQWERAMKEEMTSLYKNQTWDLVPLPEGRKALLNKWVFRVKDEADGAKRFKARMVVKRFLQREGLDYTEIFSPVVKMTSV
ncbi:reverse transcriptase domain-containing protein, partial [Serratia marcescens]|nr:hypothetical protein [Serratia marcescens]